MSDLKFPLPGVTSFQTDNLCGLKKNYIQVLFRVAPVQLIYHNLKLKLSMYKSDLYLKLANQYTAQKMKFSIKDFFNKRDQICSFLRIWSHLLQKSLMENFIF